MATITSRHHTLVKTFRRVARGDQKLALLDGWHLLEEALRTNATIETVAVADDAVSARALLDRAHDSGAQIVEVSTAVMDALSPVRTPSGVVALVAKRRASVQHLLNGPAPLVVVAVDMQDPGNVGAIVRSAEAGGATGVAFAGSSSDPWGWKALRAGMGSTLRVPILHAKEVTPLVTALTEAGVKVVATVPRGGEDMYHVDLRRPVAFLLGGEGAGLPDAALSAAVERVSIAMTPPVESLNAAVAAALLVYEARRQRQTGF
jgi:TrmH family RNA methyltransferase